jgi:hypothetical protein
MLTIPPMASSFAAQGMSANERSSPVKETKMAVAEEKTSPETSEKSWHGIVLQTLKRNDIRLVPYA